LSEDDRLLERYLTRKRSEVYSLPRPRFKELAMSRPRFQADVDEGYEPVVRPHLYRGKAPSLEEIRARRKKKVTLEALFPRREDLKEDPGEVVREVPAREEPILKESPEEAEDELLEDGTVVEPESAQEVLDRKRYCPECGAPITDENPSEVCTACGKEMCQKCNRYEMVHKRSPFPYEYEFDFPLCAKCYTNAVLVQESLAKAESAFGTGNLTYAEHYVKHALKLGKDTKYGARAVALLEKIHHAYEKRKTDAQYWERRRREIMKG